MGGSAVFFYSQLINEPVDDYMTGVDTCWELVDKLPVGYLDDAANFSCAAFVTKAATCMPRLQHLDQIWQDMQHKHIPVHEATELESLFWPTTCLAPAPTDMTSGLVRIEDEGHVMEVDWIKADDDDDDAMDETGDFDGVEDVYIIDAVDEMDIAGEINAATTMIEMGDAEAMDIVRGSAMDETGDAKMVIDG